MTERELADNIMSIHGKSVWKDYAEGQTVSGDQMMDYYLKYFQNSNNPHIYDYGMALRHWVAAAGINPTNGKFVYYLANHIQNC